MVGAPGTPGQPAFDPATDTITSPLALVGSVSIAAVSGSTLTISGPISGGGPGTQYPGWLTVDGGGTVMLSQREHVFQRYQCYSGTLVAATAGVWGRRLNYRPQRPRTYRAGAWTRLATPTTQVSLQQAHEECDEKLNRIRRIRSARSLSYFLELVVGARRARSHGQRFSVGTFSLRIRGAGRSGQRFSVGTSSLKVRAPEPRAEKGLVKQP